MAGEVQPFCGPQEFLWPDLRAWIVEERAICIRRIGSEFAGIAVDAGLTFGILWLESCRTANAGRLVVEGLMLFVLPGPSALARDRIARLNPEIAKWRLYELDERSDELKQIEVSNRGNVKTGLVHCADGEVVFPPFRWPHRISAKHHD